MNKLHLPVVEPVIVLQSKARHMSKLLYLIGFEEDFVSDVFLSDKSSSFEVIQKHQLNDVSIQKLIEQQRVDSSELALICDCKVLENNNFAFLELIKKEKELQNVPFVVIDRERKEVNRVVAMKGVDDCYTLPVQWDKILNRIDFLIQHKKQVQGINKIKESDYKIPMGKRIFDVCVASGVLLFLSPILLLIAVLIKLESKGPVLYSSKRAGTNYKVFNFLKFRSMVVDADKKLQQLNHLNQYNENDGPSFVKLQNDPRVTRIGKFIRKTSLDELPQLINVLKGDMSIIGNRPLPLYEAQQLTTDHNSKRFIAPAGLTGLWQVSKRGKKEMSVQERINLDVEYAEKHSLLMDLKIVAKTLPAMIQEESV